MKKAIYSVEDIREYKRNAVEILRKNAQYATAKATEEAFDTLMAYNMLIKKYAKNSRKENKNG